MKSWIVGVAFSLFAIACTAAAQLAAAPTNCPVKDYPVCCSHTSKGTGCVKTVDECRRLAGAVESGPRLPSGCDKPFPSSAGGQSTAIEVTINNQSDVPVIVNFTDAAGTRFSTPVEKKSPNGKAHAVKIDKANQVKWEAMYDSKPCAFGIIIVSGSTGTINVTKCGQNASQQQPHNPPPQLQLNQAQLQKEVDDAEADLDQLKRDVAALNANDRNAGQRLEAINERRVRDDQTIVRVKTIVQGWKSTSVIVTHPLDTTKYELESTDLKGKIRELQKKICGPTGGVKSGDAGSNAPPAPPMQTGTPGQHTIGCEREF